MKIKTLILFAVSVMAASGLHAQDTKREDAMKDAVLANSTGTCEKPSRPCGITNKSTSRNITATVEETFVFGKQTTRKVVTIDNISPQENRYIGCAGCVEIPNGKRCAGYKVIAAWYK